MLQRRRKMQMNSKSRMPLLAAGLSSVDITVKLARLQGIGHIGI
jgi:hypothetical protein